MENLIQQRKEKLRLLREKEIVPYPNQFSVSHTTARIKEVYQHLQKGEHAAEKVSLAGRMVAIREMGKASFAHLQDAVGRTQIYLKSDILGEEHYDVFSHLIDLGDYLGVEGTVFVTRTGELTLRVEKLTLLAKSLRPLPEKWHGLKDVEVRYRQRYLDLISNEAVRNVFYTRSRIIAALREYLNTNGFLEVETPMMQSIPGGAMASPFITHHNALDMELYLRVAPELYLKRLVVGGYEKVYEVGKNFRNEGIDTRHNPEFTMLEVYQAYVNCAAMQGLCQTLILNISDKVLATREIEYNGKKISLQPPWESKPLFKLIEEHTGRDFSQIPETDWGTAAKELAVPLETAVTPGKILDHVFDVKVKPHLVNPIFVTDYPKSISPLAKARLDNPALVERFELFIAGEELANAYSELNDPIEQRNRMEEQARNKGAQEEFSQFVDEDYLTALEYGLPPCGGLGVGIDRLTMILTGIPSIREVILFPLLRKKNNVEGE
ncbi:MAG: lysine--tRNA ligase [Elusimicrobiota bacterium]